MRAYQTTTALGTRDPEGAGVTLHANFCKGSNWVSDASFDASDVDQSDGLAYDLRMTDLMDVTFPNS